MSPLPLLHFLRELTGEKDWQSPPTTGQDRRRGKHLLWREARLCLARPHDSATPRYGATLGSRVVVGHL